MEFVKEKCDMMGEFEWMALYAKVKNIKEECKRTHINYQIRESEILEETGEGVDFNNGNSDDDTEVIASSISTSTMSEFIVGVKLL